MTGGVGGGGGIWFRLFLGLEEKHFYQRQKSGKLPVFVEKQLFLTRQKIGNQWGKGKVKKN